VSPEPPPGRGPQIPRAGALHPGGGVPPPRDPSRLPVAAQPGLPVVERDHVRFLQAPRLRWWKPLVALVLAGVAFLGVSLVLGFAGMALDGFENVLLPGGEVRVGPWTFLANNLALAASIPLVFAVSRLVFQQPGRWVSSVEGRFRWGWFWRACAVVTPLWVLLVSGTYLVAPPEDVGWRDHTLVMIVGILLTTPLQAAGEEYLVRGLLPRLVGAYVPGERAAFVTAALVSSVAFTWLHAAADPWLNAYYFCFGLAASWLVWRTGGLEAAVAVHLVNNMLSEVLLPFTDFSDLFDRSAGVGDPTVLVNVTPLAIAVAALSWFARRRGLVVRAAPGRAQLEATWAARAARWPGGGPPPPLPPESRPPGW